MSDLLASPTDVVDHDHEFDGPPDENIVRMCIDRRCHYVAVGTGTAWREPTPTESTNITLFMWNEVIVAQAMQMVHGTEAGMRRARYVLGHTDSE
jgi:hypothetical protein